MSAPPLPPLLSPRTVQLILPSKPAAPAPPPPPPFHSRRSSPSVLVAPSFSASQPLPPPPQLFSQPPTAFSFSHSNLHSTHGGTGEAKEGQPHVSPRSRTSAAHTPTYSSRPTPLLLSQHRQDGLISQLLKMGFTAAVAERAVGGGVDSVEVAVERALQAQEEEEDAHDAGHAAEAEDDAAADEDVKEVEEEPSEALSAQPATTTERHSPSIDVTLTVDTTTSASLSPPPQWQCTACTLINSFTRRRCQACNARRPDTRRPETLSLTSTTPKVKPAAYVEPASGGAAAANITVVGESEVRLSKRPCQICLECVPVDQIVSSPCAHIFCRDCMSGYLTSKVNDGHVLNVFCPYPNCSRMLSSSDFIALLPSELHGKYERFRQNAEVALDPNARWCPTAGCDTVLKRGKGKGADKLKCNKCKRSLCFSCNEVWHEGRTCEQAANGVMAAYRRSHDVRQCPECHTTIERSEGCNHMTCTRCRFQFCWLCSRRYTKHHFAFWNLWGCPGLQDGGLSWLGNDRVCCMDCGFGCGCAGMVKRFMFRLWILFSIGVVGVVFALPAMLGALLCGPCLVWRWRKHQKAKRERREQREREREERQKRRRERALARDEIDETGRVLSPEERRERRRLRREAQEKKEMEEAIRLSQLDVTVAGRSNGDGSTVVEMGGVGTESARLQRQSSMRVQSPRSLQLKTLGELPLSSPRDHVVMVVH